MIRLHAPCDATVMEELAERDELELAFIDAHHGHPMPLLDLLRLAPYMQKGGWIVLHDIKLGTLSGPPAEGCPHRKSDGRFGSAWLFDYWPWQKISGGDIGLIKLPEDKSELIPFSLFLMSLSFELKSEGRTRKQLYRKPRTASRVKWESRVFEREWAMSFIFMARHTQRRPVR